MRNFGFCYVIIKWFISVMAVTSTPPPPFFFLNFWFICPSAQHHCDHSRESKSFADPERICRRSACGRKKKRRRWETNPSSRLHCKWRRRAFKQPPAKRFSSPPSREPRALVRCLTDDRCDTRVSRGSAPSRQAKLKLLPRPL